MPARVAAPPTTWVATRTTRRTAAAPVSAGDDLAATLDRVLKVSEPEPQPRKRVTSASKASATKAGAPTKAPSTATTRTVTKSTKTSTRETETTAAKPTTTRTRRTATTTTPSSSRAASTTTTRTTRAPTSASIRATASTATASKDSPQRVTDDDDLPWTKPGVGVRERAQSAQAASNSAIKLLSEAQAAGYRTGTKSEWAPKVAKAVREGRAGVKVLRELYGSGSQRLAVERGAFNLAFKCIALDMVTRAVTSETADQCRIRPPLSFLESSGIAWSRTTSTFSLAMNGPGTELRHIHAPRAKSATFFECYCAIPRLQRGAACSPTWILRYIFSVVLLADSRRFAPL